MSSKLLWNLVGLCGIIAIAMLALGADPKRTELIDRITTVGTVWLGTTIGCCQCHDHPYDPLGQQDFYAMYAFFNNMDIAD